MRGGEKKKSGKKRDMVMFSYASVIVEDLLRFASFSTGTNEITYRSSVPKKNVIRNDTRKTLKAAEQFEETLIQETADAADNVDANNVDADNVDADSDADK